MQACEHTHTEIYIQTQMHAHTDVHTRVEMIPCTLLLNPKLQAQRGVGEMAQQLRALGALPEVLSSIPSNYMVAHSHP